MPPTPDQSQGPSAAPQGGAPPASDSQSSPSQAPADKLQMLLADWYKTAQSMAQSYPQLSSGANKVQEGINEMQAALVTPPQSTPTYQQPK